MCIEDKMVKERGEEGEGESERSLDISKSPKTVDECKV